MRCKCGAKMIWNSDWSCGIFVNWYSCPACGFDSRNMRYTCSTTIPYTEVEGEKKDDEIETDYGYEKFEPCEDAISRENAIIRISWDFPTLELPKIKESLDKLPSANPQPKTGHWIDCSNGWMCSCCKSDMRKDTHYCPSCGAKMVNRRKARKYDVTN